MARSEENHAITTNSAPARGASQGLTAETISDIVGERWTGQRVATASGALVTVRRLSLTATRGGVARK
ncbi:MAG: hypothetical protein A3K19_16450 [Lentisphaerae bacterium RIFOXYB12_FULL_65_16]|nr:MAG: hypothetical protein A3K18_24560 [Lentisphaerae bacterium RIFOXYA12_64_32]OGV89034.1 MAG: hypothetical protein A3K19_16450 [Lentisphaerae bacterium RIFOXYB12_FULL_65_16]